MWRDYLTLVWMFLCTVSIKRWLILSASTNPLLLIPKAFNLHIMSTAGHWKSYVIEVIEEWAIRYSIAHSRVDWIWKSPLVIFYPKWFCSPWNFFASALPNRKFPTARHVGTTDLTHEPRRTFRNLNASVSLSTPAQKYSIQMIHLNHGRQQWLLGKNSGF